MSKKAQYQVSTVNGRVECPGSPRCPCQSPGAIANKMIPFMGAWEGRSGSKFVPSPLTPECPTSQCPYQFRTQPLLSGGAVNPDCLNQAQSPIFGHPCCMPTSDACPFPPLRTCTKRGRVYWNYAHLHACIELEVELSLACQHLVKEF